MNQLRAMIEIDLEKKTKQLLRIQGIRISYQTLTDCR
jgi:hypothetical protein